MTAVAPPLAFQHNSRIGWTGSNGSSFGSQTETEDVSKMFTTGGPRKSIQRQNSSSSIASNASSTSTVSASSTQTSGTSVSLNADSVGWATRKKPTRGLWPPGKAEAATGITTARPQAINTSVNGVQNSANNITTSNMPMLSSPGNSNGSTQPNGVPRQQTQNEPSAILHLIPINGTFDRKTITVPYYPEVLRIGRQTNQKTIPTPINGFFDSKVLSRQHAEIWADRQGRVFIRDVKSSNGTFVNGMRLSQENKESEPRELREQDVLELGIDIVSEDQKTVVHHKVAAKVEHAGIYGQGADVLSFGDLDPSSGSGGLLVSTQHQLKRNGSQNSLNGRGSLTPASAHGALAAGMSGSSNQARNWLNPITTEQIVKKLNMEMKLAIQQSQDLMRARQCIDALLDESNNKPSNIEARPGSERSRASPVKSKQDLKAHFSEPPAPPPQAPLPEKPDVARALADPVIQPLLRRSDTARPASSSTSPTRADHSSDILRLCEELKLAQGKINNQTEKMKTLEDQLAQERTAREDAEERAMKLESGKGTDSSKPAEASKSRSFFSSLGKVSGDSTDLQSQITRLQTTMDEMKQQMEQYRRRAESAESERDDARRSLADLVEAKRAEMSHEDESSGRSASMSRNKSSKKHDRSTNGKPHEPNGHTSELLVNPPSPTAVTLLERAGLQEGQPITPEQAKLLTQLLRQEVLGKPSLHNNVGESALMYHGRPLSAAALVVIFGVALMSWMNTWPKVER